MYRLLRFGLVGVAGFIVDAGVLVVLVQVLHSSAFPARIVSFVTAATVTFILNKYFTFRLTEGFAVDRWLAYLALTAIGACINVGIYRLWIMSHGTAPSQLVVGTAIGSVAAMFVNYFISSMVIFKQRANLDLNVSTYK